MIPDDRSVSQIAFHKEGFGKPVEFVVAKHIPTGKTGLRDTQIAPFNGLYIPVVACRRLASHIGWNFIVIDFLRKRPRAASPQAVDAREPATDVVGKRLLLHIAAGISVQVLFFKLRQLVVLHSIDLLRDAAHRQCGVGRPPIVVVKVGKRIVIGDGIVGIFEWLVWNLCSYSGFLLQFDGFQESFQDVFGRRVTFKFNFCVNLFQDKTASYFIG